MGKVEFLEGKILENNILLDLKLSFEQVEKIEFDIKNLLEELNNTSNIKDENSYDVKMFLYSNNFFIGNEGFENYDIKILKLDLKNLINEYKLNLENIFHLITENFLRLQFRCHKDISRFYKLRIEKLLTDIDFINKDTIGKKITPDDLDMYYNNPYTLLHNTLIYHKDILQVYYNNLFSFDLDILEQSKIISNGLDISFSDIDNLKKWEDSIEYNQFSVNEIIKQEVNKNVYSMLGLMKKD